MSEPGNGHLRASGVWGVVNIVVYKVLLKFDTAAGDKKEQMFHNKKVAEHRTYTL